MPGVSPSPCVPRYMRQWQHAIRSALNGSVLRWRSCAVVGSSNSLMHTARGTAIDANDAILRVNAAPTRGYEAHAGARTTMRVWGVEGEHGEQSVDGE